MEFVEADALASAKLQDLVGWYRARCGDDGAWPARDAFRPETLPPAVLPHIGRVDVESAPFRIYYRAIGSVIADSIGTDISGCYLDETGIPQAADVTEWYRLAVAAPGGVFVRGEQTVEGQAFVYEGCCLPLGEPADEPRAFVIGEDFLNTEAWRSALHRRRYDRPN